MILNKKIIIFFLLMANAVFAQETIDSLTTQKLNEVVVTATRTSRELASLPIPTTIITAADISKTGVSRLSEIISEQTGLIMVPDFGGGEGIQIQGIDSAYTMILIDGVPLVGRLAGTMDLSRVAIANIDRIEIVKGASSSLYGSEAMAGVINVITKKPKSDSVSGSVSYRYASFNTHDANVNLVWKEKKLSGSIFANYFSSDGYDLKVSDIRTVEPYLNTTIHNQLYYDFSKKLKLTFGTRIYNQTQDYKAVIDAENYQGNATVNEYDYQLKFNHKWNAKINSEYEIYATNYKTKEFLNDSADQLFEESNYDQWLFRPEIRTNFSIKKSILTTGIGFNHETLNRTYFANSVTFNSQYFFAQYDFNPFKKINILTGFRYDKNEQYQSQFSPKFAVNYKISENLSLKSSIGYGYKAPDFRQLYFDFTNSSVGYTVLGYNVAEERLDELESQGLLLSRESISFASPLKPESSVNTNFGVYYQKKKLKVEVNAFYNLITNLIDTKIVARKTNGQSVFTYLNVNRVFTYGIENSISYNFTKQFQVSFGYQYLIAKDKSVLDAIENGQVFARDPITLASFQIKKSDYLGLFNRSRHTANIKFFYTFPEIKTAINARIFYRSKYGISDTNGNQIWDRYDAFVKEYLTTNVSITKTIAEKWQLQFGANNVFDFTNPQEIPNIPGRQIFGKFQFNF